MDEHFVHFRLGPQPPLEQQEQQEDDEQQQHGHVLPTSRDRVFSSRRCGRCKWSAAGESC